MVIDDKESSGYQHSTSKPKKKKIAVSRKEFLNLQAKVDQIVAALSSKTPQSNETSTQSLIDRVEILETRECMTAERIVLWVEMGIRDIENRRTVDHK